MFQKIKTLKFLIIFLFVFTISLTTNIFAYNFNYKTKILELDDAPKSVLRKYGKSSVVGNNNWYNFLPAWKAINSQGILEDKDKNGTYETNYIGFQGKKIGTNYTSGDKAGYDKIDPSNLIIEANSNFNYNDVNSDLKKVELSSNWIDGFYDIKNTIKKGDNAKDINSKVNANNEYDSGNDDIYLYRERRTSNSVVETDYVIPNAAIYKIWKKYKYDYLESNNELKIRFSFIANTGGGVVTQSNGSTTGYENRDLETGNEAISVLSSRGFSNDTLGKGDKMQSILNAYDNWLYIPIDTKKIKINQVIHNDDGSFSVSELKEDSYVAFEDYQVSLNEYSSKISQAWGQYYVGCEYASSNSSFTDAQNKIDGSSDKGTATQSVTIPSTSGKYIVFNFYFDRRNVKEKRYSGTIKLQEDVTHTLKHSDQTIINTQNVIYNYGNKYNFNINLSNVKFFGFNSNLFSKNYNLSDEVNSINVPYTVGIVDNYTNSLKLSNRDREINFNYEYEPPVKLIVYHCDINGNFIQGLKNSSEVAKTSNQNVGNSWQIIPDGYNQRYTTGSNDATNNDCEQFTLDATDSIKVDRSRTLRQNGIKYNLNRMTVNDINSSNNIMNNQTVSNFTPGSTVVVKFYYDQEDIDISKTNNISAPSVEFEPSTQDTILKSGITNDSNKTVYVPAGEYIKPYLSAISCRAYTLKYDINNIDTTNGNINYKLKDYSVYQISNGKCINDNNTNTKINSTGKEGLFHIDSDRSITIDQNSANNMVKDNFDSSGIKQIDSLQDFAQDGRKTNSGDYIVKYLINSNKYNGKRNAAGKATYKIVAVNVDSGSVGGSVAVDKELDTINNGCVNVLTPLSLAEPTITSSSFVNHSNQGNNIIQRNTSFELTPKLNVGSGIYSEINSTEKYLNKYYVMLDFAVRLNGTYSVYNPDNNTITSYNAGKDLTKDTIIIVNKGSSLKAVAIGEENSQNTVSQFSSRVKILGETYSMTENSLKQGIIGKLDILSSTDNYIDIPSITKKDANYNSITTNIPTGLKSMKDDAYYYVEYIKRSINIGRIYDFKVTDCLDIDYKTVFRKNFDRNSTTVNDLTNIKYYSGFRKFSIYGEEGDQIGGDASNANNKFTMRDDINSGNIKTVLLLGPYKNTNVNYIKAPKLGYRISFDLKTTGTYAPSSNSSDTVRYVKVIPSYYYISKDGNTFNKDINIYYKDSSGNYKEFNGSKYTIYFKPNDGYRQTYNLEDTPEKKYMSTKLEALTIGDNSFNITDNMMTTSDNDYVQAWYGEFKLPNSTIAVTNDINNPLKDGYVGVKFDLQCIDKKDKNTNENDPSTVVVDYTQNDKTTNTVNTTQWDYEGYLGFGISNIGSNLSNELKIPLEKGTWKINNQAMYDNIKGTVVLYDLDNRAAQDFD